MEKNAYHEQPKNTAAPHSDNAEERVFTIKCLVIKKTNKQLEIIELKSDLHSKVFLIHRCLYSQKNNLVKIRKFLAQVSFYDRCLSVVRPSTIISNDFSS